MKRVVLLIIDGLRADMMTPEYTPRLADIAHDCRRFSRQQSVFPTVTRVNSASISTGCYPGNHGLAGNAIALDEGEGLIPVSVGPATFRERWRRATGRTLHRPTLTERLKDHGGAVIYSNSSPGAAHMQDPDSHGSLYHRSGSFAPGMQAITGTEHLEVMYDATGDAITTRRCCEALLNGPDYALTTLWICEPDHSQHALELGSPEHRQVLSGSDRCAQQVADTVEQLRARGEQVLFIIASDHGHETTQAIIPVEQLLIEAGFKAASDSTELVLAAGGMGALLYLSPQARAQSAAIADWLREQDWTDQVYAEQGLTQIGHRSDTALAIAFGMAKQEQANRFGIMGLSAVAADRFMPHDAIGYGQHGGFGPYESNPLLLINGGGFARGVTDISSSTIDIAPTILNYLDLPVANMDGKSLSQH